MTATTVAATMRLAALAGIRVFATGGLGGVHRGARDTWDESADLTTLSTTPVTVVCAGVKSILDVPATLERLETLNVTVLGYGTQEKAQPRNNGPTHPISGEPVRVSAPVPADMVNLLAALRADGEAQKQR